ncbi:MAG: hypothetical protein FWE45_02435 [Firmicutes bacterium]|nr:hypothetical protein [Bacillota bacterium]
MDIRKHKYVGNQFVLTSTAQSRQEYITAAVLEAGRFTGIPEEELDFSVEDCQTQSDADFWNALEFEAAYARLSQSQNELQKSINLIETLCPTSSEYRLETKRLSAMYEQYLQQPHTGYIEPMAHSCMAYAECENTINF